MGCASLKLSDKEEKQLAKQLQHTTLVGQTLNKIRKKPYEYVKVIERQLQNFKGQRVITIEQSCNVIEYQTVQGVSAWKQAIRFLKSQYAASNQLIKNSVLCEAAAYRALHYFHKQQKDKLKTDRMVSTHDISSELKTISGSRVKPGDYAVIVGMDFKFRNRNYIQNALVGMIIDDGIPERTNRNLLFSQNFKYFGCFTMIAKDHIIVVICLSSQNMESNFATLKKLNPA